MAITLLSSIGNGVLQGFSITSAVVYINPNTTTLSEILDEEKISWLSNVTIHTYIFKSCAKYNILLVSIPKAAEMISMLVGGSIADFIGRKHTLIIGQICIILGWILVYFAKYFPMLLVGRFVTGLGTGLGLPVQTLQLSEIALIKMRGTLSMMNYFVMNCGNLYSLIVAANCSLYTLIIMSIAPAIIFLLFSFFLPESPLWLVKKGYTERAKKSLLALRGSKYEMNDELFELDNLVRNKDTSTLLEKLQWLKSRNNAIPCIVMATILMLQV